MRATAFVLSACFIISATTANTQAVAGIATFESYKLGFIYNSFTDQPSGITFYNPQNANSNAFAIQIVQTVVYPGTITTNAYLTANFYYSDPLSWSFTQNFGFDGLLPSDAATLSVDVYYQRHFSQGTIVLTAFDDFNQPIGSDSFFGQSVVEVGPRIDMHTLTVTAPLAQIHNFTIRTTNGYAGFDNVAFSVPEPSTLILAALSGLALLAMRRRRCA